MRVVRKPLWLQKKVSQTDQAPMRQLLAELRLNTVCQQALCPNISECFSRGHATFLLLGTRCTRLCAFCNLEKKEPEPVDADEPKRVAEAVARLGLAHVMLTSPTRDDLFDGGSAIYAAAVAAIRAASVATRIELLLPDMQGKRADLGIVAAAKPDIIGHNIETVPRLYHIRSGADYQRSLETLRICRELAPESMIKSGLMLGLGEQEDELSQVFTDLRAAGCDFLSIGQYLAPSQRHYPVHEYILPERFDALRTAALQHGFLHVESGSYIRSSYNAAAYK